MRIAICVSVIMLLMCGACFSQCTKDLDCKGDRICANGQCVDASSVNSTPTAPAPKPSIPTTDVKKGKGAGVALGIMGLAMSTAAIGCGIAAAATSHGHDVAVPSTLGGISLIILGADVPISEIGGSTSRDKLTDGVFPLRIVSWVTYGATLGCGVGMIATGVAGGNVPEGLIIATVINEAISGFGMSIDALVSGAQASHRVADSANKGIHLSMGTTLRGGVSCLLTKGL